MANGTKRNKKCMVCTEKDTGKLHVTAIACADREAEIKVTSAIKETIDLDWNNEKDGLRVRP